MRTRSAQLFNTSSLPLLLATIVKDGPGNITRVKLEKELIEETELPPIIPAVNGKETTIPALTEFREFLNKISRVTPSWCLQDLSGKQNFSFQFATANRHKLAKMSVLGVGFSESRKAKNYSKRAAHVDISLKKFLESR